MADVTLPVLAGTVPLAAERHGLKASWLDRMRRMGERVPAAFSLDAELALRVAEREPEAIAALERALCSLRQEAGPCSGLAVRASPTVSMPGALLTRLAVADDRESVSDAVRDVVASGALPHVRAQWQLRGEAPSERAWIGVLVQRQLRFDQPEDFGAVVFTHDPSTGEPGVRGEYAQGGVVDVVSGRTRPLPLENGARHDGQALMRRHPAAWQAIVSLAERLTSAAEEPLELELAFVAGQLWLLQARSLTLSPRALVRMALAAIDADSPGYARWLSELAQRGLAGLVEQRFAEREAPLLRGLAASPGAATGVLVTSVERALVRAAREPVVLVRPDAVPEDVAAFRVAKAVVTSSGGLTCHAAVIARALGLPAVVGVSAVRVDARAGILWGGRDGREVLAREGDLLSVDARRGVVHRGALPLEPHIQDAELSRLFIELRKLRPTPLWVYGAASQALRLKEDACLDGALCTWPEQGELPASRGRECWLEIDAAELARRVPALTPGWGVVVTGALQQVSVATLRAQLPLRAIGWRMNTVDATPPDAPVDLLLLGFPPGEELQKELQAARLLRLVNFPEVLAVPQGNNVGWVCPVATAALTALRYAARRHERPTENP